MYIKLQSVSKKKKGKTNEISSEVRRDYRGFLLGLFYLALASLAVAMVLTSSTAELKSLMFSEEYRPAGLLYWLVTTLEPNGRALLLWLEPMCFTSCQHRVEKLNLVSFSKSKRWWVQVSGICETYMPSEMCKPEKTFIGSGGPYNFLLYKHVKNMQLKSQQLQSITILKAKKKKRNFIKEQLKTFSISTHL